MLTQPFGPTGTNISVPGSGVAQVVSIQARVNTIVPFSVAETGVPGIGTVLLVLVMVIAISFSCNKANEPGFPPGIPQTVPALGKIGIEPLAWQPAAGRSISS